ALVWAERFSDEESNPAVSVSGGGSGVGIAGLTNGTVDVANATRRLKPIEIDAASAAGFTPFETIVGFDAPAFIVHPDNPIASLTASQLAEVLGEDGPIDLWSQLGVSVSGCPSDEIVRISRQSSSGTYEFLRRELLGPTRDYKLGSRDLQGSREVVEAVAKTPCALGYTALAYVPPAEVKMPCFAFEDSAPCVTPSMQSAEDGTYPLFRPLLMVTRGRPQGVVGEYMAWVLSDVGQCVLEDVGYATARPLTCGE
ncbi:MAG: substrate-binding domain-containing protein, partial [Thermoanaerobaculia bacterium]